MARAVRFDQYGDVDVLNVVDVERPVPGPGEVLVRVKAAGINPGEASIRQGRMHAQYPATFPSGEGSDLAAGGFPDPLGDPLAIGDRDHAVTPEPFVVSLAGQPDHLRPGPHTELHGH